MKQPLVPTFMIRLAIVRRPSGSCIVATTPPTCSAPVSVRRRRGCGRRRLDDIRVRIDPSALLEHDLEFTSTRPWLIKASEARREAMPAWARTF